MALRDVISRLWNGEAGAAAPAPASVRASGPDIGQVIDLKSPEAGEWLRHGAGTASGAVVGIDGALRVAAGWRCVNIIAGAIGGMPLELYRRVSERERQVAVDHPLRDVLTRRPNGWQTPFEFKRMLTALAVLKGNGYGLKITSRGRVLEVWPLFHPVRPVQRADMSIVYEVTRKDGSVTTLPASDILHLRGLSLDGVNGLGVLQHAREAMGLSLQGERSAAKFFRQGYISKPALVMPSGQRLSDEAYHRLKQSLDEEQAGAENAGKMLLLEEGLEPKGIGMSADDIQFLEGRKFQRSDIAMFFGVPPHMIGDVEKTTSWGSGIDAQGIGFVTYTLGDWITAWEETIRRDLIGDAKVDRDLYAKLETKALLRGDIKARTAHYTSMMQWGVYSPNEVRALEDVNPRDGGDVYYDPPNTAGGQGKGEPDDDDNVPPDQRR